MSIEQAIFTSAKTARLSGYQVVAASAGLRPNQIEKLAIWAPAHDSLLPSVVRHSINFHQFDETFWCLSITSRTGDEYSGRGGSRLYTHCLFLTEDMLDRFSWHPFRLWEAVHAAGRLRIRECFDTKLPAFDVVGQASIFRPEFLALPGGGRDFEIVMALVDTLILNAGKTSFVYSAQRLSRLLDQAISLLPMACRRQVTFSTGLRDSKQRSFSLMAAPDDQIDRRRLAHQSNAPVCELDDASGRRTGWSQLVTDLIRSGQPAKLVELLEQCDPQVQLAELAEAHGFAFAM